MQHGIQISENTIYTDYDERLSSFSKFGLNANFVKTLTDAGFYAIDSDTYVCFNCNLSLCNWVETQIPAIEHARHNKTCSFLLATKGSEFIKKI